MSVPILSCENVEYREHGNAFLRGVSFVLEQGQRGVILADPHRCATFLLRICATLLCPTAGQIRWFGRSSEEMKEKEIYALRRRLGLVHRESSLISNMTIEDNVTLGMKYHEDIDPEAAYRRAAEILRQFDLYEERLLRPAQLTFEKRRLAVYARELVKEPQLFLLEHPSLDLGERFYSLVMDIFHSCRQEQGCAFLVASLSPALGRSWGDWVLLLHKDRCNYLEAQHFDPDLYTESARRQAARLIQERRSE